ncbi:MAG: hypothetical protein ACYTGP_10325 [Planctomycetota bacterium]|jgi:hypothetical protein
MSRALGVTLGILAAVCLAGCAGGGDEKSTTEDTAEKAPPTTAPADE